MKRYREDIEAVVLAQAGGSGGAVAESVGRDGGLPPAAFRWRGRSYTVRQVLGHWCEEAGWWRRPDGVPVELERTELWRVEAASDLAGEGAGVYELTCRGRRWRLDRVWD